MITLSSATSVVSPLWARAPSGKSTAAASRRLRISPPDGSGNGRDRPYGKMLGPEWPRESGACPPNTGARIIGATDPQRSPMHRVVLVCCLPFVLAAQQKSPGPKWEAYVKTFDTYVAAESIVGASTWLIKNGKLVGHH